MKCNKCGGELEIDFTKILTSLPAKYEAKCKNCGNIEYILCSECHSTEGSCLQSIYGAGQINYVGDINVGHDEIHGCQNEEYKPQYYSGTCRIGSGMMEKLQEIEISTVDGKKQYICTSEIWQIADKVNEIVDYINKQERNSDKDHRIAVLERALWNTITFGHSKRYFKKRYEKAIAQAEKELEVEE